jgi:hypothetical protein
VSSPDHPTRVIGAAPGPSSRTWFAIADGGLSALCYPRIDHPILDSLRLVAADAGDVDGDALHDVRWMEAGVPTFIVESRLRAGSLTTQTVLAPDSDALVLSGVFRPDRPDARLRLRAEPHGPTTGRVLDREPPALAACIGEAWVVLIGPFDSCGVGATLTAELAVESGAFEVALGFGDSLEAAETAAHAALATGASALAAGIATAWRALPGPHRQVLQAAGADGAGARCSMALLRCLEDKQRPGTFARVPGAGLRSRDGVLIASALLDAGDVRPAQRALAHAEVTPEDVDDPAEMALPILLAWRLRAVGALDHDPWPWLVRRAAAWLVKQTPPSQAEPVAGLLAAADFAGQAREPQAAEHLQVVADHWQAGVDSWERTSGDGSFAAGHADLLRRLAARGRPRLPDLLQPARRRYQGGRPARPVLVWHESDRAGELQNGRALRVQVRRRGTVAWTADGWATSKVVEARNTGLGCWVADLATGRVRAGATVEWTASYADGRWEPSGHRLLVLPP